MHDLSPLPSLAGGVLIGLSASLLMLTHGKIAGISNLYGGVLRREASGRALRLAFIVGLLLSGVVVRFAYPQALASSWMPGLGIALLAGVVVGFGSQLGNGCTSGHGVCGISRFSARSIVATVTFLATGAVTVFVMRHLLGGGR